MSPRYYDIDGNPMEMMEWARRFNDRSEADPWWQIGHTVIGEARVSTVWMGLDHSFLSYEHAEPLIFETLVFGGPMDGEMERYSTRQEAADGHARMVAAVDQALSEKASR